jgi:hypothetical protein
MLIRVYWWTWGFFGLVTLLLFATGHFTMLSAVVLGFIAFGLTFMGMMGVLPMMVSHPAEAKPRKPEPVALQPMRETPSRVFGTFKSA